MNMEHLTILSDADVLRARKLGRKMASGLGFDTGSVDEIEIAVSEIATNLIKHRVKDGELILSRLDLDGETGIEVRSEDKGPGIKDIASAMKDNRSTAGSLGLGLSGVRRLMHELSVESGSGGTTVVAKRWLPGRSLPEMNFSVMAKPIPDEDISGDAYFIRHAPFFTIFAVIDGLGHGIDANKAAVAAVEILEENYTRPLSEIIEACHTRLRNTRGAAMALCRVDHKRKILEHVGIGNVETRVYGTPEPVRPFFFHGTLGMKLGRYKVREYPYIPDALIVMFSDGILTHFDLPPHLLEKNPQEITAFIFDNYTRDTDDATVLVGR